jgi:2'-5' RNA ligase superfamily
LTPDQVQGRPSPIIVSALFGSEDFRWLDGQRKRWFPPERNVLPVHLTLFHHLPPSVEQEVTRRLREECQDSVPDAVISSVISLGGGTAYRVASPGLEGIRERLRDAFAPLLTPQDAAGWRAHITIQNKVTQEAARQLRTDLERDFKPRRLKIDGLAAWRYEGGPWTPIAAYRFGSGQAMKTPPMPG